MQIAEKHQKSYSLALNKLKTERRRFNSELEKIEHIGTIPSQANYIMIEITGGLSAKRITETLLSKYGLFVKDLTSKLEKTGREFIRIAVRNTEDNNKLIDALKDTIRLYEK